MNFLRQKFRRDTAAVPHATDIVDGSSTVGTMLLSDKKADDKSKRLSYFMTRTSSSPLLRRRDAPGPPPPAMLADNAGVVAVVPLADSPAPRIQRRRSIPGVAYLMAAKRSVASKGAGDDLSMAAGLTVPERAAVHSGSLHAVAPRMCKSVEHAAVADMPPVRRASDCSSSTASSGSSSSGDDNSSDSGSGGDSDDTLAPADALEREAEAAPDSNLLDVVTLTGGDGSGSSSVRSYYSCSAAQPLMQLPTEPNIQISELLLTSAAPLGEAAEPTTDSEQAQLRPQRRQLRLGRWRAASISIPHHSDSDTGISRLAALAMRPARLSLGSGPCQQQIRQLCDDKASCESEDNNGQAATAGPRKVQRLLSSLSHTHTNLGLSLGGNNSSGEAQRPHTAHRKLSGALGKLLLTPPPPSAAEQAKMDAWTADDDEFSASEYDLSGTYFELMPTTKRAVTDGANSVLVSGSGRRKHSGTECTTPESRLSSTSTVVDEGAVALGPEQYKRIFVSSARKLQLQCGRRGMSCVVHIKTMMTKASEHYVVVSGGRNLDAYRISRQVLADLYLNDGREDSGKERLSLATAQQQQQPTTAYPARQRSVGSNHQAQRRARRAGAGKEGESRPAVAGGNSSRDCVVEVPLSSPPPLSPSAEIADAALAKIATAVEDAELAEYGMGDLVSLGPTMTTARDSDDETHNRRPTYRRYRRRRASKWGRIDSAGSQSGVAGAIAAL
ncbi:hypothetical protein H4R27_005248 [Coemansia aciculifera]|nr:hypothetical protein H4R27_005248 [Coemansia aciculifera]